MLAKFSPQTDSRRAAPRRVTLPCAMWLPLLLSIRLCVPGLLLALGIHAPSALALDPWRVVIAVPDRSDAVRRQAEQEATEIVLVRISGDDRIMQVGELRRQRRGYRSLVRASGYEHSGAALPGSHQPWSLVFEFDQDVVTGLLRSAGLRVWGGRRPHILVWMVQEEQAVGLRRLLDVSDPVATALLDQAHRRGLPVQLPLLDLTDLAMVSAADVWGRFRKRIAQASARYGAEMIIGLLLYRDADGQWVADWFGDDALPDGALRAAQPAAAARGAINFIADHLAAQFAVTATRNLTRAIWLQVGQVGDIMAYARVLQYLENSNGVTAVRLHKAWDQSLLLQLDVSDLPRLLALWELEGRLTGVQQMPVAGGQAPLLQAGWQG